MSGEYSDGVTCGDGWKLIKASSVKPEKVEWLWTNRIPRGETVILEGDPGVGKSMLSAALVAAITTGRAMPGGEAFEPRDCLIANLEDHRAAVTVPRLIAAGADMELANFVELTDQRGYDRPVRLPDDLDCLEEMIADTAAALLIIDPLAAALPPEANMDRDQDVRDALGPLAQIGREYGTTILILRHLNKSIGKAAIHRGAGSTGIGGLSRSVLLQAQHPHERDKFVLTQTKTNAGARAKGLVLRIETAENGAGRIVWEDEVDLTSDEVLNEQAKASVESAPTKRDECEAWLRELLANGPVPAKVVEAAAVEAGYALATLRRARRNMKLRVDRVIAPEGVKWVWRLRAGPGNDHVAQPDGSPRAGEQHEQVEQHEHLAKLVSKSDSIDGGYEASSLETPDSSPASTNGVPFSVPNKIAEPNDAREGNHQGDRVEEDKDAQVAQVAHFPLGPSAGEQLAAQRLAEPRQRFRLLTDEEVRKGMEEALRDRQAEGRPCPECPRARYLKRDHRCVPCMYRLEHWRA